ncbi:MAG TPA: VOC family protein [Caulobacteraceae bacterium]|nr:VOC family protein [Caulobacteraceae bacterium]
MPNLENLRKQAKLYLRWHRAGRHPVAAAIRAALPRYAALNDAEIMAKPFKLAQAQELVARRQGFESWRAMNESPRTMSDAPAGAPARQTYPGRPVITTVEPQIFVTDFARALDFYTEKLGFSVGFTYGEPAFYGQVVRDAAMLNLRWVSAPVIDRSRNRDLASAAFNVSSAKQLFLELQQRGVSFREPLHREPWHGQGSFIVEDPDGNLLIFGGRTD